MNRKPAAAAFGLVLLASAGRADAQSTAPAASAGRVTVTPSEEYRAGGFKRTLLGSGWRDVWMTPVNVPVLDLDTYAGGLKFKERGGGFHSLVLHLQEADGWKEYRFRSVEKFPKFPEAFQGTLAGKVWKDQVSILFPGAPLLVPPIMESVGLLHVKPELYVMEDSPILKEQRDSVAGLLGTMELKGQEAPDDKPGFGGSSKITGTEKFMETIAESRAHRLDEREFLAARLVDFLINDVDRSFDNFDWARFGEQGAYTWRPIPRDRDQAFVDSRGLLNSLLIKKLFPKQIPFTTRYDLKGLTYTSYPVDRRLLQRLDANAFRQVAARVQRSVTDEVIARAVAEMPAEWRQTDADERITSTLRARRDGLTNIAMAFYGELAGEVDVHGTEDADRFEVFRHPDGRVTVSITDPERPTMVARQADGTVITTSAGGIAERDQFFSRTFLPGETNEVRLYAHGGNDHAVVHGAPTRGILVRVIGGKGDDILADSAGGKGTTLYDFEGSNQLVAGDGTDIDMRPWTPVPREEGFRADTDWRPDWGGSKGISPAFDYNTGAGVILGVGHRVRKYGFRRLPHAWEYGGSFNVGLGNGRIGLAGYADYRFENAPTGFRLEAEATQLEATRFFGYGNNTVDISRDLNLVEQQMLTIEPTYNRIIGWRSREGTGSEIKGRDTTRYSRIRSMVGEMTLGPRFAWISPDPEFGSPLQTSGVLGSEDYKLAGAQLTLELDRTDDDAVPTSGWRFEFEGGAYPKLLDLDAPFSNATGGASFYVPLGRRGGPHLAFRAGGSVAAGDYPVQFAAAVGGSNTLRGYTWRRFAGDASANGGAELRVPVGTLNFIVKSQLGLFALTDAGRVWYAGANDGGWHTSVGGGFWLSAFGRSLSVAYANGEGGKLYLSSGLFY